MPDFIVQMGCGRRAGVAGIAEQLAALDVVADLQVDIAQVAVDGRKPVVMDDLDHLAQTAAVVHGSPFDHAIRGRIDRGAHLRSHVDPPMHGHALLNRVEPHAELAGHDL